MTQANHLQNCSLRQSRCIGTSNQHVQFLLLFVTCYKTSALQHAILVQWPQAKLKLLQRDTILELPVLLFLAKIKHASVITKCPLGQYSMLPAMWHAETNNAHVIGLPKGQDPRPTRGTCWGTLGDSLRNTDIFPVVASLYPQINICETKPQNDFCDTGQFQPIAVQLSQQSCAANMFTS